MSVYISIGNSDDKLTQAEWAGFYAEVDKAVRFRAVEIHGVWLSLPNYPWQNACWCIEIKHPEDISALRRTLSELAAEFKQDSVAWAEAPRTDFLGFSLL